MAVNQKRRKIENKLKTNIDEFQESRINY